VEQQGWLGQLQSRYFMRMVKENAKVDELFAPHLVVYNNRFAWFRNNTDTPFIQGYQRAAAGDNLEPVIQRQFSGTTLRVRPTISADRKYITLDIYPSVTRLIRMGSAQIEQDLGEGAGVTALPIDLPTTFNHSARTFATLPDGGSILMSGLAVNVHMRGRRGIPLMQDLPVVGNVFSNRAYQKEKRNFVIMLNARMILLDEEEVEQTR
jgi:type II secretory pathway component GspD/PulD (secretin)